MTVRTIEVKVDESAHGRAPEPGSEEITWAALDTAWNLLRETAVRLTLLELRTQATEQGVDFPATDEELFQTVSGVAGAPTTYLELAPDNPHAAQGLFAVLQLLANDAFKDAQEALQEGQADARSGAERILEAFERELGNLG